MIAKDSAPLPTYPRARFRGHADRRHPGHCHRNSQGIPDGWHARRDRGALDKRPRDAGRCGRRDSAKSRSPTPNTRCPLITWWPRRRHHRTSPGMTACATGSGPIMAQGDGITEMYEKTRAEGFGAEVKRRVMIGTYVLSAGLLRRLLQPRPQGARADQARLSNRSSRKASMHDPDTRDTVGGVRAWPRDRPIRLRCISTTCSP